MTVAPAELDAAVYVPVAERSAVAHQQNLLAKVCLVTHMELQWRGITAQVAVNGASCKHARILTTPGQRAHRGWEEGANRTARVLQQLAP